MNRAMTLLFTLLFLVAAVAVPAVSASDSPKIDSRVAGFTRREITPVEPPDATGTDGSRALNYGSCFDQLDQINVTDLHDMGFSGAGVIVCMPDTGFCKDHEAFAGLTVLDEWDFINYDGNTQNEGSDPTSQHNHGTCTWSTLGGLKDGTLYGPAYGASFLLAKTEDQANGGQ